MEIQMGINAKKRQQGRSWPSMALLLNPVLVQAIGLTPVILGATTLRASLWISAISVAHLFICEALAAAFMKKWPGWLRPAVYFVIGLAIVCPVTFWLDRMNTAAAALRLVLPLFALNALAATRCERYAVHHTVQESLRDAAANGLGFTVVAVLVGAVRELFGKGTLFDIEISSHLNLRGFWMPFGGFIMLGFFAAALKSLLRWFSSRGIYTGAELAMELAPEDRQERMERTRQLMKVSLPEEEEPPVAEPPAEEQPPPAHTPDAEAEEMFEEGLEEKEGEKEDIKKRMMEIEELLEELK